MKKAVHFGAGKIGRGFIAELLHDSGYEIVFADVVDALIEQVNGGYSLFLINHGYEEKIIDHVSAYSSVREPEKVIEAICEADVITTSVMASNLPKIAPLLARGLKHRLAKDGSKVIIMACENAIMGTDILKKAMLDTGLISADELNTVGAWPNTAVDRMVFDGTHNGKQGVEVGDAFELAIERGKLPDPTNEPIQGAEYVDNLEKYLQRKIYIINCGHAISGYFGQVHGYETVQDVLRDPALLKEVRSAMLESASALERKYGFTHEELVHYMDTMMIERFLTPGVSDPVTRVAREPIRKLSPNDRIIGPASQCEAYGLDNHYLLKGAACALLFHSPDDEQANELQAYIAKNGVKSAICCYTGLGAGSHMFNVILEEYNKLS